MLLAFSTGYCGSCAMMLSSNPVYIYIYIVYSWKEVNMNMVDLLCLQIFKLVYLLDH